MFFTYRYLASHDPVSVSYVIFGIVFGVMYVGRWVIQGNPYQITLSGTLGALAFFYSFAFAGWIMQRPGFSLPEWLSSPWLHGIFLALGYAAGFAFQYSGQGWQWGKTEYMDLVYKFVLLPLIVYGWLATLLIIVGYGTWMDWGCAVLLYGIYGVLFGADKKIGCLDQVPYARAHQIKSRLDSR
jgi:hypothetical protein